jgi:Putative phage abortive infection protein
MQYYGLLGDYVGGVWGTIIGAITLLVVFGTWRTSRRLDYKTKTYQVFAEMLRTHEEIISSIEVNGSRGRDAFAIVLSEFYFIYRATWELVPDYAVWSVRQRIDVAYTFMYYGLQLQTQRVLSKYDPELLKNVADHVTAERQRNEAEERQSEKRTFKGHQNRLSHYFRNLFAAYRFIDQSDLSEAEKRSLGKVLRAKLSNYEQAVLVLNIICHLGQAWERSSLLAKYQPIKNVPKDFFSFDERFALKNEFPYIVFEWEAPIE